MVRVLARADPSVAQLLLAHFVVQHALAGLGDTEPAPRLFAEVLAGARIGNASVERGTARSTDRHTSATRQPDGRWRVDGRKYYATGALGAAWIAVAAVDPAGQGPHVLRRSAN